MVLPPVLWQRSWLALWKAGQCRINDPSVKIFASASSIWELVVFTKLTVRRYQSVNMVVTSVTMSHLSLACGSWCGLISGLIIELFTLVQVQKKKTDCFIS